MVEVTDREAEAGARALARCAWGRFQANDSGFARMKYPEGVEQYVNEQWPIYAEDAVQALTAALAQSAGAVEPDKWAIDNSTENPILTYENCSVIQDEQAHFVLGLIRAHYAALAHPTIPGEGEIRRAWVYGDSEDDDGNPIVPLAHGEGEEEAVACERCQGNGEIVTDWERYLKPHRGDVGDEAVATCPDCDGRGRHDAPQPDSKPRVKALRETIARIISPWAFDITPEHYGLQTQEEFKKTMSYGAQLAALGKADRIIGALEQPSSSPRVKALEWEDIPNTLAKEAKTSVGDYYVTMMRQGRYEICDPFHCHLDDCDEQAAFSWCQADYERRVLSALEQPGGEDEDVAEYSDEAMLQIARDAINKGVSRSSFSQCAEWSYDEISNDIASAPKPGREG